MAGNRISNVKTPHGLFEAYVRKPWGSWLAAMQSPQQGLHACSIDLGPGHPRTAGEAPTETIKGSFLTYTSGRIRRAGMLEGQE